MTEQETLIYDRLVDKSIDAFTFAIEIINKPTLRHRSENFVFNMCNAWELMLKAQLVKDKGEDAIYYKKNKDRTITLSNCIETIFTDFHNPVKNNLTIIEKLRNKSTHFITQITEALLDNIVDEIQERMVEYNVNGYINLLKSDHTNIDLGLMFFKTMSQLNDLDIRILKVYSNLETDGESIVSICNELNLELNQIRFIKEKLERFGLLQSRNEEMNDDNLDRIVKYLEKVKKENRKRNPNDVKVPSLKRVSSSDSYRITSLGRSYLTMIK